MTAALSVTYHEAIRLVINVRTLSRLEVLGYFAEDEHGRAGEALDGLVRRGFVTSVAGADGPLYRLGAA